MSVGLAFTMGVAAGAIGLMIGRRIFPNPARDVLSDVSSLEGVAYEVMAEVRPDGYRYWDVETATWLTEPPDGVEFEVEGFELTTSGVSDTVTVEPGKVLADGRLLMKDDEYENSRHIRVWGPVVVIYVDLFRRGVYAAEPGDIRDEGTVPLWKVWVRNGVDGGVTSTADLRGMEGS